MRPASEQGAQTLGQERGEDLVALVGRVQAVIGQRADFVYLFDPYNNAPGSYAPEHGQTLAGALL